MLPQQPQLRILKNPNRSEFEFKSEPRLRELKPLHIRIQEYNEARGRIFGRVTNKIRKARERYKVRKRLRHEISSASLCEGEDSRLYTRLSIGGQEIIGLLDSGATVTCLGKNCMQFVAKAGLEVHNFSTIIKTADGTSHPIVGRVRSEVRFRDAVNVITFYLVPTVNRELFLGRHYPVS
ncbi:uncharacterized protein LOC124420613, partial [Lucilia cuprina]|uniref:uncharacterized protein LOC124420613 n=1 Tax=Lucilia cuprina TaxID=7375 RepID=UPI001F06E836